ncbi:hypothetical protein [Azospirillum soli]|uniref:hypothetical protein n=1 Tax=Azospirillum soli TaxID=1304799 RepID=UPI0031B81132|nr:hypothetical protein [Azospirillum soli]
MTRLVRLLVALAALGTAIPALAQGTAQHLFYEVVSADVPADASYEARQRLTERARDELVPAILSVMGLDQQSAATELRMGGYRLHTNPSLHTAAPLADAPADRLAAAIAWTFSQDSVLVADFGGGDGTTGYALVRFPEGTLTPATAQRFFEAATTIHDGLGGGYTAFGDTLLFLNLRGPDGQPYSGLSDADFTSALRIAVAGFPTTTLTETGLADARLVTPPPANDNPALIPLRARHAALIAETFTPEPAR